MSRRLTKEEFIKNSIVKHGQKTIEREKYLESIGYTIVSIWESDFKKIIKSI